MSAAAAKRTPSGAFARLAGRRANRSRERGKIGLAADDAAAGRLYSRVMPTALAFVLGLVPIASLAGSLVWMARGSEITIVE
jgi:hypothetical protein